MVSDYVIALHQTIPDIRLQRYRKSPDCDLHMLTNYFWNIAVSEAFYPTLHSVELALRNTVHHTLTIRAGVPEWWTQQYTISTGSLTRLNKVKSAYLAEYKTAITTDRLIAGLNFGFWVTMLSGSQQQWVWKDKKHNWIDVAFPHRNGTPIEDIHKRFDDIRRLRNRIMHYECIFDRQSLPRDHADIHEALQWISPDLHFGIHAVDSFQEVYDLGWERAYVKLHRMLGGP